MCQKEQEERSCYTGCMTSGQVIINQCLMLTSDPSFENSCKMYQSSLVASANAILNFNL